MMCIYTRIKTKPPNSVLRTWGHAILIDAALTMDNGAMGGSRLYHGWFSLLPNFAFLGVNYVAFPLLHFPYTILI